MSTGPLSHLIREHAVPVDAARTLTTEQAADQHARMWPDCPWRPPGHLQAVLEDEFGITIHRDADGNVTGVEPR